MKIKILFLCCFLFAGSAIAQQREPDPKYVLQSSKNPVQYKNFYLLTLMEQLPELKKLIQNDGVLSSVLKNKKAKISESIKNCNQNINCFTQNLRFSDDEILQVGTQLKSLLKTNSQLEQLVKNHLIPSGCYVLYNKLTNDEILQKAWEQDAKAINHIIGVYVEGKKANYAKIDSISFDVKDKSYPEIVNVNALLSLETKSNLFFEPSMNFALVALEINGRNDAGDYEPMMTTVNKAALLNIKKVNFNAYKYSLILVPGEGPEDVATELSAGSILRCRLAAQQYRKGVAPFIMVSGGRVHPFKTKYSEAFEMKKFLMQSLQIPENAIIMEPHARHTTTNLRNAARIIFRYGLPMDKPGLVVTVYSQSSYIENPMHSRCMKELGYEPYRNGKRLSGTELEFFPSAMSLQIDFDEPMDP